MSKSAINNHTRRRSNAIEVMPEWLPGATEFTDDRNLVDPVFLIEAAKKFPNIIDELLEATDLDSRCGRRRLEGKWALIMMAFVISGHVDVEPFCGAFRDSRLWQIAGFQQMPTVQTVWNRLTELESHAEAFVAAANTLIQRALAFEPAIAENVWVDATGFETHAVLEHCCENHSKCRAIGRRPPKYVDRAGEELIKEERHRQAAEPPAPGLKAPDAIEEVPEQHAPAGKPPKRKRPYKYFRINGHTYRSLDHTSGARYYAKRKRFWFGGYNQTAISMYTGAPLAINIFKADEQEHEHYGELYGRVLKATDGIKPQSVVLDRGYSINSIFEHNSREGVASIMPFRKPHVSIEREDLSSEKVDMHGIPRCKHCGGPGEQRGTRLGFYFARDEPRIRFRCILNITDECSRRQSVACKESWRLLLPLSRTTQRYHALKKASRNQERHFRHWRARYKVAGANIDSRPKRPGLAWQQLRASAALFAEWFRLCLRHGWLGSHRQRNHSSPLPFNRDERALNALLGKRRRIGLDYPYGPAAVSIGLGGPDPPKSEQKPRDSRSRGKGSKITPDPGPIPF